MSKITARQQQAINTRISIMKAAMELFKNASIADVKITDICKEASVSVGTFYHYFNSKDQIIKEGYNLIDQMIIEKYNTKNCQDTIEKILWINTCIASTIIECGAQFISNCYRQILLDESQYTLSPDRAIHKMILSLLEEAQTEHLVSDKYSSYELAEKINKTARGNIFDWCLRKGDCDLSKALCEDIENIIHIRS